MSTACPPPTETASITSSKHNNKSAQTHQRSSKRPARTNRQHIRTHLQKHSTPSKAFTHSLVVHLICTESQCNEAISTLREVNTVGFDCEGVVTLGRSGKVSLIQVSSNTDIFLFDILVLESIPLSLANWLQSERCTKCIHDSRQDQDALYHLHNIQLSGIFDTTVAELVERCWLHRGRYMYSLKGMDSVAADTVAREQDYKVVFRMQKKRFGKAIKCSDALKPKETNETNQTVEGSEIFSTARVNCFDGKQAVKELMRTDAQLWARRPIPMNLAIYACVDAWLSLLMGRCFEQRFNAWQVGKVLVVSAKWCRMVAKRETAGMSSAKVPASVIKMIRANTRDMSVESIPSLDKTWSNRTKICEEIDDEKDGEDNEDTVRKVKFDDMLLMMGKGDFVAKALEAFEHPSRISHDKGLMEYSCDIHKLHHVDEKLYVRAGKMNYAKIAPCSLIYREKDTSFADVVKRQCEALKL